MTDIFGAIEFGTQGDPPEIDQPPVVIQSDDEGNRYNLPPGVHPQDPSVPYRIGQRLDENAPVAPDGVGNRYKRGTQAWDFDNSDATPVFQRLSDSWTANTIVLSTGNNATAQVVGRQEGRESLTLWVPSTATAGVVIAPTEGEVQNGAGITLSPGDSIDIPTEAPVYAGLISGQLTGTINVVSTINPAGGALGAF